MLMYVCIKRFKETLRGSNFLFFLFFKTKILLRIELLERKVDRLSNEVLF